MTDQRAGNSDGRQATNGGPTWYVGDRVEVDDPALAQLRAIFEKYEGKPAPPNHRGFVDEVRDDGTLVVLFDDGVAALYPAKACTRIAEGDDQ